MSLFRRLGMTVPIIQAPMAGVSTPQLAAAVSNTGALGSLGLGAASVRDARRMMLDVRALTSRPFNVNVFMHQRPEPDAVRETAWLDALAPEFRRFEAEPPPRLQAIYRSFAEDDDMRAMLVSEAAPVVSFHFGLPDAETAAALKAVGCILLASATSLTEALACREAGMDAVVAQGWEAGGHRGMFDPQAADDQLGVAALTRLLVVRSGLPVIAAGGIMDGRGVRAVLDLGAVAAQLGTAFVACPESGADDAYRAALRGPGAHHTVMTSAISGRPARCLGNRFTRWAASVVASPPGYPVTYDAGKALNAAAKTAGESGFGAQWAGQGAPLSRSMPAAALVETLAAEMH